MADEVPDLTQYEKVLETWPENLMEKNSVGVICLTKIGRK